MTSRGKIFVMLSIFILFTNINFALSNEINIANISISPILNISYLKGYNVTTNVFNATALSFVRATIYTINGDGTSCWWFYPNGTCAVGTPSIFNMSHKAKNFWEKTNIMASTFYPKISFGLNDIFWYHKPQNLSLNKFNYHLFHFVHNFSILPNTSLFIEIAAIPESSVNSKNLIIYIVERGHNESYFHTDWRNLPGVEVIGSITKSYPIHHTYTSNSSRYLVPLKTNNDGTIDAKHLNISNDFWIVLYSEGTSGSAWKLFYRNESLCNNTGEWFVGASVPKWKTTPQSGCPDLHINIVRKTIISDGLNVTITANSTEGNLSINSTLFYFGEMPNFPPIPSMFVFPKNGTYSKMINITWEQTIDPNGDIVVYNLSLLNSDGSFNRTLNGSTIYTNHLLNSTLLEDGVYDLLIEACDPGGKCSNFTLNGIHGNFIIDNTAPSILLISPPNQFSSSENSHTFIFNVTDTNNVANCSLIVNDALITTLTNITKNNSNTIHSSLPLGTNTWKIICTDLAGNINISSQMILKIISILKESKKMLGGGISNYIYEVNKGNNKDKFIQLKIKMSGGIKKEIKISNDRETSIKAIAINSRKPIQGEVKIFKLETIPKHCTLNLSSYKIYKILEFNSTIDYRSINDISVDILVPKEWLEKNSIKSIHGIICNQSPNSLNIKYIKDQNDSKIYRIYSSSFSTWLIFGLEIEKPKKEIITEKNITEKESIQKIEYTKKEEKECFVVFSVCWYWVVLFFLILAFIVLLRFWWKKIFK